VNSIAPTRFDQSCSHRQRETLQQMAVSGYCTILWNITTHGCIRILQNFVKHYNRWLYQDTAEFCETLQQM